MAKKYSAELASAVVSGSRLRFVPELAPERLPIMARSFAVASLITGRILLTPSLNLVINSGSVPNRGGREKGSWRDQNVW